MGYVDKDIHTNRRTLDDNCKMEPTSEPFDKFQWNQQMRIDELTAQLRIQSGIIEKLLELLKLSYEQKP